MDHNTLSLSDVRAAATVLQTRSFRTAAGLLGQSPSALSRQISGLEERLGVRLFDRDTRNVRPTASGEAFGRIAQRMLNAVENGMAEFDAHVSARQGRLVIAGLPSVTAGLLPRLIKDFSAAHPGIDLRILDALSGSVLEAVESGAADLGFAAGTVSTRSRLDFLPLMDDEFVAIGHPDGPLADDRAYAWAEIVAMPFIAMAEGTSVRELLDGACLRIGTSLSPRFEVSHLATSGALVSAGLGVTSLPTLTLPVLDMGRLIQRPISDFGAKRRIGLVRRTGKTLSPAAQAFFDLVQQRRGL
ncbi:LysR family transcriptional regulator [Citreimonas sp.]|uniref:LysR family transcriptional regulator n=1 Tax=Citreimonas sp. TaxID=3036715 RepID=UPI004058AED6